MFPDGLRWSRVLPRAIGQDHGEADSKEKTGQVCPAAAVLGFKALEQFVRLARRRQCLLNLSIARWSVQLGKKRLSPGVATGQMRIGRTNHNQVGAWPLHSFRGLVDSLSNVQIEKRVE